MKDDNIVLTDPSHPTEQLAPLISGELNLATLASVTRHVRRCETCQADLLEVAVALGALRGVERDGLTEVPESPPLTVHPVDFASVPPAEPARPHRIRLALAAAAAVVVLFGAGLLTDRLWSRPSSPEVVASAVLKPKGTIPARGIVEMSGTGEAQIMTVTTTALPPAPADSFYEVWLLQPDTGQMVSVGVLPESGTASYALPASLAGRYQAVDVSLQPDNGVTEHSGASVLRAVYA